MTLVSFRRPAGDDGIGLVLVLGMGAILTGLMILSTTTAIRSLESSREHVSFESALALADGGIDTALARAQRTYVSAGTDSYLIPSPTETTCTGAVVAWPVAFNTTPPTAEQERTWARQQLELLADPAAGCLQTNKQGDYVILKPQGRQTVYALGWSPSKSSPEAKRRLLKAEYLFTPYSPSHAILTGGSMTLDASTKVTSAPPNAPALAAVHTNGTLFVDSGNPTVFGPVTQSAASPTATSNNFKSNTADKVAGAATQPIPFEGSRAIWGRNRATAVPGGWYDLCPDGSVHRPDGSEPCDAASTVLSPSGAFRGWSFTGSATVKVWSAGSELKQNGYSGTYYVHHADVLNPASNSGSPVPNLTVLASSTALTCNKVGGNIRWGSTDPLAPSIANTWLVADQDLMTESNYQAGSASGGTVISGFFLAGDQIEMSTSSNGAYGAVIAAGQCAPASGTLVTNNSIKNPSIFYDPNAQAPFTDVINNTLWLEYGG